MNKLYLWLIDYIKETIELIKNINKQDKQAIKQINIWMNRKGE